MIALTIILVIIAVAGFAVTTALRKACDVAFLTEGGD